MRKLFSIFVALLAATSLWAYDFQAGDLYYNITSSIEPYTVEVTRCSSYDNYSGLTTATIPNAVTYNGTTYSVINIGGGAFSNCSSLTSVIIPHTVTKIGAEAFSNCFALSTVVIPSSVIQIESHAFENCYSIISLSLPNSVERIDNFAFYNCTALKSLSIPEKLIHLGDWALGGCSSITNIILPESLTFIAWGVFEGCANLQSILIPKEITVIGFAAFNGCRSLQSITIPEKVIQVGEWAFHQCQSLDTVYSYATIPPILEVDAFNQNEAILFVPCGLVETYKSDMYWSVYFSNIQCIEEDEDTENNIYYTSFDGNIVTPNATDVFGANIVSNEYKDGQGVITFDGPVTGIGSWAFANCSSLSTITIPNSVTSVGDHAFYKTSLTSIAIPDNVRTIGGMSFYGCARLTSVWIGKKLTSIEFYACPSLESIIVSSENEVLDSRDNCNAVIYTATNTLIAGCRTTVIPNSVTSIGRSAFEQCSSLTSVTIPNSVTNIGERAFMDCSSLTSITIPERVTSIDEAAFFGTAIDSVYVKSTVPPMLNIGKYQIFSTSPICYIPCGTLTAYEVSNWSSQVSLFVEECEEDNTPTDLDNIDIQSPMTNYQKLFRDGQLIILRDGVEYNAVGGRL